jgi:hypothetical protein
MRKTIQFFAILMIALTVSLTVQGQRLTLPSMTWEQWNEDPHVAGSFGFITDLNQVAYYDGTQTVFVIGLTGLPSLAPDYTLYEIYAPITPWVSGDLNLMLENEAFKPASQVASDLGKPLPEVVGQYFATKGELEGKVTLDVMIYSGDDMTWQQWYNYYPARSEFTHLDVTVIHANVGDFIKVNVNAIYPYDFMMQIGGYYSGKAINGIHLDTYPLHSQFAQISAQVVRTGHFRIGTMLTGLKQGVLFIVNE